MPESPARAGPSEPCPPSAAERRGRVRHPSAMSTACVTDRAGAEVAWTALIQDVSASGLGLVLPRRFEPGAVLFVEPFGLTAYATRLLPVMVARVAARDGGVWLVGCEFFTELSEDEVRALR